MGYSADEDGSTIVTLAIFFKELGNSPISAMQSEFEMITKQFVDGTFLAPQFSDPASYFEMGTDFKGWVGEARLFKGPATQADFEAAAKGNDMLK